MLMTSRPLQTTFILLVALSRLLRADSVRAGKESAVFRKRVNNLSALTYKYGIIP